MKYLKINFAKYDKKMKEILNSMGYFECEICKCLTPKKYEGTEPNTCEMCMPLNLGQNQAKTTWFE